MKIKVKKEYNDVFEAMKEIGDKLFKDGGEPNVTEFLKDGNEIEFSLFDEGLEFEVLVKDEDVSLDKNIEKEKRTET